MLVAAVSELGARLLMKRRAAGLSRKDLSEAMGGTPSQHTIWDLELGGRWGKSKETIEAVRRMLKLDMVAMAQKAKVQRGNGE